MGEINNKLVYNDVHYGKKIRKSKCCTILKGKTIRWNTNNTHQMSGIFFLITVTKKVCIDLYNDSIVIDTSYKNSK